MRCACQGRLAIPGGFSPDASVHIDGADRGGFQRRLSGNEHGMTIE
jgi:hypothetical protein